jgi:hypothetical protein
MNLSQLKWTKNVKPQRSQNWAYTTEEIHLELKIFALYWRNWEKRDVMNAGTPQEGELILLRQHGKVTHIVELVNNRVYFNQRAGDEFNIYRLVQVLGITNNWDKAPDNSKVFDCDINFPMNGKVIKLENIQNLQKHWGEGGLGKLQEHIEKNLQSTFTWYNNS